MKTYLLWVSTLAVISVNGTLAQSIHDSEFYRESDISEMRLDQRPQKVKLNKGEIQTWQINVKDRNTQFLHIKVNRKFRIGSFLKVFTPFAAAKAINHSYNKVSQSDQSVKPGVSPVNISAGVLATIGAATSFHKKSSSTLRLSYQDKNGLELSSSTIAVPNSKPVDVPITNCGIERVVISVVSTDAIKVHTNVDEENSASSARNGVTLNSEGDPCHGPGGGGTDYGGTFYSTSDDGNSYGDMSGDDPIRFPTSLTNPTDGETMMDQNGAVSATYNASVGAWVVPDVVIYPEDRQGATLGSTIVWLYSAGEAVAELTLTSVGWIVVVMTSVQGDTSPTQLLSKGGHRNIWPDQFGYPPNVKDVDWNDYSDDELAQQLADEYGDSARGQSTPYSNARKWFRDKRPKGPRL